VIIFAEISFSLLAAEERQEAYLAFQRLAARAGLVGDVVIFWQDRFGGTKFLAPAQQHAFFQIMKYDQLYAQVNGMLDCGSSGQTQA
jgi:hypothetical protein